MKKTRKIAAMIAAMALTATMAVPGIMMSASAAATPDTITFTGATTKGTHTYTAYRIFNGTAGGNGMNTASGASLGNATWAGTSDATLATFINALKAEDALKTGDTNDFATATTVNDIITKLATYDANSAKAKAFAAVAVAQATACGLPSVGPAASLSVDTDGYYVISETFTPDTSDGGSEGAQTAFLLGVYDASAGAEVTVKSSMPTVEKKVQDINDSAATPTLSSLQDSADYDIGDIIPYTITATIGEGITNFDAYSLQFVDDMSAGLTMLNADNSAATNKWKVEVKHGSDDAVDVTSLFGTPAEANSTTNTGGKVYTWSVTNIKPYASGKTLLPGDTVTLTYFVQLDSDAVVGAAGNPNTVSLKYDNNPNSCGQGAPAGETPKDKNIVFTYKTVFNKTDGTNALNGANFDLYKKTGTDTWTNVTALHTGDGAINPTKTGDATGSTFEFSGLDDGDYKLVETVTPPGYNSISDIYFTITADHDITSADPRLNTLTGNVTTGTITLTANASNAGILEANVVNTQGAQLPSTGGMGTTLFILGGGVTAAAAGIYLVSKKRAKEEDAQ